MDKKQKPKTKKDTQEIKQQKEQKKTKTVIKNEFKIIVDRCPSPISLG